jgi:hypothetical protein
LNGAKNICFPLAVQQSRYSQTLLVDVKDNYMSNKSGVAMYACGESNNFQSNQIFFLAKKRKCCRIITCLENHISELRIVKVARTPTGF